jgi:amino acid permease
MRRLLPTVAVLTHLVVSLLHGSAHSQLAIALNEWQKAYVIVVIALMPLVALLLVWTRHMQVGLSLLVFSMFGALVFGSYYHYVGISNDHVAHLPPGNAQGLFRTTAMLLVVTEMAAVIVGVLGLRAFRMSRRRNQIV